MTFLAFLSCQSCRHLSLSVAGCFHRVLYLQHCAVIFTHGDENFADLLLCYKPRIHVVELSEMIQLG